MDGKPSAHLLYTSVMFYPAVDQVNPGGIMGNGMVPIGGLGCFLSGEKLSDQESPFRCGESTYLEKNVSFDVWKDENWRSTRSGTGTSQIDLCVFMFFVPKKTQHRSR